MVYRYIKKKLSEGATWDGGLRRLVALCFRGCLVHAIVLRLNVA